jgi:hypothetical protein
MRVGSIEHINTGRVRREVIVETSVDNNHVLDVMLADAAHQNVWVCDRRKPNYFSLRIVVNKRNESRCNDGTRIGVRFDPSRGLNLGCLIKSCGSSDEILPAYRNLGGDAACNQARQRQWR